ncbi:chitotriosidase-1-like isoform X2 [Amblyomma americanum]
MRLSSRLYKKRLFPSVLRIALIASQCLRDAACSPFKHICYLTSPKNSSSALPFERVDVKLCSHIILGFATVSPRYSIDLAPLGGEQALTAFAALRRRNPKIKLMISVGGGAGDRNFKEMVAKTARRYRFIDSARSALEAAGLDGLDLDWEFPRIFDAVPFARLIKEMSSQFRKTADRPLILSVAVPAPSLLVVGGYRVRLMARFVDFVNLMTYDLNTYKWYTPWVDHNSPLYARAGDPPYFNTLNVESSAELWVMLGMPNSKIMVGIPTYGLSWVLRNPEFWDVGSLAIGRHKYGGGYVNYPQNLCSSSGVVNYFPGLFVAEERSCTLLGLVGAAMEAP